MAQIINFPQVKATKSSVTIDDLVLGRDIFKPLSLQLLEYSKNPDSCGLTDSSSLKPYLGQKVLCSNHKGSTSIGILEKKEYPNKEGHYYLLEGKKGNSTSIHLSGEEFFALATDNDFYKFIEQRLRFFKTEQKGYEETFINGFLFYPNIKDKSVIYMGKILHNRIGWYAKNLYGATIDPIKKEDFIKKCGKYPPEFADTLLERESKIRK